MRGVGCLKTGVFEEGEVRKVACSLREQLGQPPDLALLFASPEYRSFLPDLLELVTIHGQASVLVGCTGSSVIGEAKEWEDRPGFSLAFFSLPGCRLTPFPLLEPRGEGLADPAATLSQRGVDLDRLRGALVFYDPFEFPIENWLVLWNEALPGFPVGGGAAGGKAQENEAWVFWDRQTVPGGIGLAFEGPLYFHCVVSQGCRPIGEAYPVTRADRNILYTLGPDSAYQVLHRAFESLTEEEKEKARGRILIGMALPEALSGTRGEGFVVRNVLGADPVSGAVAIGMMAQPGQTLQYQLCEARAASHALGRLLTKAYRDLEMRPPVGAFLFACNGRGRRLFGIPDHDVGMVSRFFPDIPIVGFFANGELGPVGLFSYLHSFSASIVFLGPEPAQVR
ncbi:Small ligand-binding sensory domain FIST [Candidatus Methylacidithermus pantelleriae]|uniref:Small ligand-binding sensory domain FIST n=2 Tax=Candidatus Methylacidithermus pantelleriae TaxID=2744239 RepID=A0A8J2FV02_9BACT|nr:Small ligand-binding sensory domain FIST [Candidatus Methylacidithermus pantelleriae]